MKLKASKKKILLGLLAIYIILMIASTITRLTDQNNQPNENRMFANPQVSEPEVSSVTTLEYGDHQAVSDTPVITLTYHDWAPIQPGNDRLPIILLHGSPGEKGNMSRLAALLREKYRVIVPDLPGFGGSSKWIKSYSNRAHARYVLELMDQLKIDEAHVLGFSMGSGVSLRMVEQQPDRVRSLIFYGGIGVQEAEFSGDYHFEHMKYGLGLILGWGMELVPHFGQIPALEDRNAFLRNFWDTDQRDYRGILQSMDEPFLILHGRHDPLVYPKAAEIHHDLVQDSELVMYDASHFMVFKEEGAVLLAEEITPFIDRHNDTAAPRFRRTRDYTVDQPPVEPEINLPIDISQDMSPWTQIGVIMLCTYILEDPSTIAVGLLVRDGQMDLFVGILGVFLGIFTGDLGLYLIGYVFGRRLYKWKFIRKRLPTDRMDQLGHWFDKHGWTAVLASRFIVGTRLPLYVSAGMLGKKPGRFALWTFLAVLIWAPTMVLIVFLLGDQATSPFKAIFGDSWLSLVAAVVFLIFLLRTVPLLFTSIGRCKLKARYTRWLRWEFWPMWLFYAPVIPRIVYLWFKYGGAPTITITNSCMELAGFAGESKVEILKSMPEQWVIPFDVIEPGETAERVKNMQRIMEEQGWHYPVILKPNEGQRGLGIKLARSLEDVQHYLEKVTTLVMVQHYHPGPYEAGVFYYRMPDEENGRIFSMTDKAFPILTGDGKHSIKQLIWRHKRYRMQAEKFLKRLAGRENEVLAEAEQIKLAIAGNHSQGTMFLEGAHLITPALEKRIDEISKHIDGFYFGRYDLRYSDVDKFKAGEDMGIIELNGVTSEATNIYDPSHSLWHAYKTLSRQWEIAFQIGKRHREMGVEPGVSVWALYRTVRKHFNEQTADELGD